MPHVSENPREGLQRKAHNDIEPEADDMWTCSEKPDPIGHAKKTIKLNCPFLFRPINCPLEKSDQFIVRVNFDGIKCKFIFQ